MNISAINFLGTSKINTAKSFATNPLAFKGSSGADKFEKSTRVEEMLYQEKLKTSPKTAFLYDPKLTVAEKEALVEKNPDLYFSKDISSEVGQSIGSWHSARCFEHEEYCANTDKNKNKIYKKVFDMSIKTNKENFEKLKANKKNLMPSLDFAKKAGFDEETYKRYLKNGYIKQFTLTDKETGAQRRVPLIDVTLQENIDAVERLKKLTPQVSKHHSKIIKFEPNIMVNVLELQKLGYGDAKSIAAAIEAGKIKGEIKKSEKPDGKKATIATVDISDRNTERVLRNSKNSRCVDIKTLASSSGVSLDKIEDAILAGEMDGIFENILLGEAREIFIDTKNVKNIEAFDKLLFEKKIEEQLIQTEKEEAKKEAREADKTKKSITMKLVWHLCPNTKGVAKKLISQNKELAEIFKKEKEIKEEIKNSANDEYALELLYDMLLELKQEEEKQMKIFYKSMWKMAGVDEYREALKKAKELMVQAEKEGISSIEDSEIRAILSGAKVA